MGLSFIFIVVKQVVLKLGGLDLGGRGGGVIPFCTAREVQIG